MTLLLAAVGATLTALLELTAGTYVRVGTGQPHLVLVFGIVVTVALGLEAGLVWAFVGGLAIDVLTQRPLGSTAFALLLCVGATHLIDRVLTQARPLVPVVATVLLTVTYSLILLLALNTLDAPIQVTDPVSLITPGAIYDIVLAAVIGPVVVWLHDRRDQPERLDW